MCFQQIYTFKTVLFTKFLKYMLHDKHHTKHIPFSHGLLIDLEKVQLLIPNWLGFSLVMSNGDATHSVSNGLRSPPLPAAAPPMVWHHSIQQRATTTFYLLRVYLLYWEQLKPYSIMWYEDRKIMLWKGCRWKHHGLIWNINSTSGLRKVTLPL
jgi:hypothetical protein